MSRVPLGNNRISQPLHISNPTFHNRPTPRNRTPFHPSCYIRGTLQELRKRNLQIPISSSLFDPYTRVRYS
uniref:Uncharacterized protein n=1 Tax=Picea sitchensis TaxID=3332 RepID=D5AB57_PICSI|nr:unknown [Picea sitchensis]